jgi:hypothetical protein
MSSSEGLGHAIFKAGSLYIIPKVFAALVATIALALLLTLWSAGSSGRGALFTECRAERNQSGHRGLSRMWQEPGRMP